jgi:hypothetical protein
LYDEYCANVATHPSGVEIETFTHVGHVTGDPAGHLVVETAQVTQTYNPAGEVSTVTADHVITETVP